MKERINYLVDSFVDYKGVEHKFVVAAVSSTLPKTGEELGEIECYRDSEVTHEVNIYVEDYGTWDYLGIIGKVVRLGVAICNPTDVFNEQVGMRKAVARARNNEPAIYANIDNMGVINTELVKALLKQEAGFIKENPDAFIAGYNDAKKKFEYGKKMEKVAEGFTDFEKQVIENLEKDPGCLANVVEYLGWKTRQEKHS